jgi:hypothetical protein
MAPVPEWRIEDIVATIFGEKSVCGFIVNFDGSPA